MGAAEAFGRLNERQREAACFGPGPLLIIASAGTGKTSTLAHRVAHLLLQGVAPERILLLTFTRRAALEMTRRAGSIASESLTPRPSPASGRGEHMRLPWSGTFHSIANRLIRRHAARVGLTENFSVLDAANALMREASRQYRKDLRSSREEGARPRCVTVADDMAQAKYVVDSVLEEREEGVDLRRQAVLFRSSHHSDVLELELLRRNIPYVKYGGLKFLEAAHVKDALALLRWADNPRNRVAAWRAVQLLPGIGPKGAQRIWTAFEAESHGWRALKTGAACPAFAACAFPWPRSSGWWPTA